MKGSKRFRSGAWRIKVQTGRDPVTGKYTETQETVRAPNSRAGAKVADARLAELIAAVESGQFRRATPSPTITVSELADRWQLANRPRQNQRTGEWIGWSPKTAKTHADNFRLYILPTIGQLPAERITGVQLDDLYLTLEAESGLSAAVVVRCHSQLRAMFNWALRKKLVPHNPALAADPPKVKRGSLQVPSMDDVRRVIEIAKPSFAVYIQIAAGIGARRGTIVALRWGDVDLDENRITFHRAIAESATGLIEKGTKADRPYVVSLGPSTASLLREHRTRCIKGALAVGHEFGPRSFVFSDDGGATHWGLSWPSHAWKRYSTEAGLKDVRLHDLRHTAASQLLMAGIPISIVAERLGCTEANILRTYRHFIPGSDVHAAALLDSMLDGTRSVGSSA